MKYLSKLFITARIFLLILVLILFSGCSNTVVVEEIEKPITENEYTENEILDTEITIPSVENEGPQITDKELDITDDEPISTDKIEVITPPPKNVLSYYGNQLVEDSNEQKLYLSLYEGIKNRSDKISIPIVEDTDTIYKVYEFVRMDNPQFFYFPTTFRILRTKVNGTISAMEIEFVYDSVWTNEKIQSATTEIETSAKELLQKLSAIDGEYNKIIFLYSYLAKNIEYNGEKEDAYSIYGALVDKKATCEGFSEAFKYILNLAEIDAITVIGYSKNQAHQWNMAKIDSQWYFFDVTWDAPTNTTKYLPYNYFGLSYNDIITTHDLEYSKYLTSYIENSKENKKYNYYYYSDLVLHNYSEKELVELSKYSESLNDNHISFRVVSDDVFDLVLDSIQTWLPKALKEIGTKQKNISYMTNDELNIIDIYIKEEQ